MYFVRNKKKKRFKTQANTILLLGYTSGLRVHLAIQSTLSLKEKYLI